jgi:hypothetical protein
MPVSLSIRTPAFRANYADTVAGWVAGVDPYQNAVGGMIWARHGWVNECNDLKSNSYFAVQQSKVDRQYWYLRKVYLNTCAFCFEQAAQPR